MAQNYLHTMIGERAKAFQAMAGSREAYARMDANAVGEPDALTPKELSFIAVRDSLYMASVTEDGWPYLQHRGGAPGFVKWLGGNRIAFADYRGNRQFLSTANLQADDRVSLFLMDYPNKRRLKLIGHAALVELEDDPALIGALMGGAGKAMPERAFIVTVIGFDWNCPQFITPRFTEAEIGAGGRPLTDELIQLRAEVARLRALLPPGETG